MSKKYRNIGDVIRDFMCSHNLNAEEFGHIIHYKREDVLKLLNGELYLTPNLAVLLGKSSSITPGFWMSVQSFLRGRVKLEGHTA